MRNLWFGLILSTAVLGACKTTSSATSAWAVNGDAQAGQALIVKTVIQYLPNAAGSPAVLQQFAAALQDQTTAQTATPEYVLQVYYDKTKKADPAAGNPFDIYVIEQFLVLTNYVQITQGQSAQLAYIGTKKL